jgi:hypothetical protein
MGEDAYMVLLRVSLFSPLLPLSILLLKRKSASGFVWKALFVFLGVSFACDFLADWLAQNGRINMPVIHVYNVLIGTIICYYYARVLRLGKMKVLIRWLFVFFLFVSAFEFFYRQGYLTFNTVATWTINVLTIFFTLVWFYQVFFSEEQMKLTKLPEFWVNVGFFFYFGSTMVLTLFSEMILYTGGNHELTMKLWPIQLVTNIVFNLIILRAVWALKRA